MTPLYVTYIFNLCTITYEFAQLRKIICFASKSCGEKLTGVVNFMKC